MRNRIFFDNYSEFKPQINDLIHDALQNKDTSIQSIQKCMLVMIKNAWKEYQAHVCNEDISQLFLYKLKKNDRYCTVGIKISILRQSDHVSLEVHKNTYLNAYHVFQVVAF